jgi:hypothetical protein
VNTLKGIYKYLLSVWASLPHWVQAILVAFAGGALTEGGKLFADFPDICWTGACFKHDLSLMISAGVVAARAFYMLPNGQAQLVAQAKAQNAMKDSEVPRQPS